MPRLPWPRSGAGPADRPSGDGGSAGAAGSTGSTGAAGGPDRASLGELVARVADSPESTDRRAQLTALARGLAGGARDVAGSGFRGAGALLADVLAEAAPRLRIRDAATLRRHHPGLTDAEIAEVLTRTAARTTAALGAAVGALAAVEFAAPPTLVAAPVQLAAEALAVAAVEVKLTAELHEISGLAATGSGAERGATYLSSWVKQRALDPHAGAAGLSAVLGAAAKRELRTVLTRRTARGMSKLVPFLAGAVAGGVVNRRATRALGDKLVAELRPKRY